MRKEIEITIEEGRDAGKTFKVTEMSAVQMDRWAMKALCLFGKGGTSVIDVLKMSITDLLDSFFKLDYEKAEPLLNELLACASFKKDGVYVNMSGSLVDSVVEDSSTLSRLRYEALKLCFGFFVQGGESESK